MLQSEVLYLQDVISKHIERFFTAEAIKAFKQTTIKWCSISQIKEPTVPGIYIPVDVQISEIPKDFWEVPFDATSLTFWNPLVAPSTDWVIDDEIHPLWFVHHSGAIMPAWNLAPTLFHLLTLKEEVLIRSRDVHDRFIGKSSPRYKYGLLEKPIFNDSIFALVGACFDFNMSQSLNKIKNKKIKLVKPPILVLSHDLDQLRGNDLWTQAVRALRVLLPRCNHYSRFKNIWFLFLNCIHPKRYYFDNVMGMISVEQMLNMKSSLYFLNGSKGRFGARSGVSLIPRLLQNISDRWNLGIHYNYDTHLNPKIFCSQLEELKTIVKAPVITGRSHYLRFNPEKSWKFFEEMGIKVDESVGYYDLIGYRAGIAGPFNPYDFETKEAMNLIEIPLIVMDGALLEQYQENAEHIFEKKLKHLSIVGGLMSMLFHPGIFNNPEYPEALGLYRRMLGYANDIGINSMTSRDFIDAEI